ncbi:fimbria/pilus outer membrane usher protein [Pantoea dispersa]|uniref:Fimbrial biogenesis outer membrane usher protein n=1 Tax=Pantoea dispersa TaxID=59814 RepID=A0ABY2ZTD1_9GAMM|nr:fimbria/pilus outer membrane usher protein [Pantoea dispersa]TQC63877.1 fimbrial biogenesis outer membrane usher protein [Pantoea dispersa]
MSVFNITPRAGQLARAIRLALLSAALVASDSALAEGAEKNVEFDPVFLQGFGGTNNDLSRFSAGSSATPGRYQVSVYLGEEYLSLQEVTFNQTEKGVIPCLSPELLAAITFNDAQLPDPMRQALKQPQPCSDLAALLPDARATFDSSEQRLTLSIPQRYLRQNARGEVDPLLWNRGINSGFVSYGLNAWQNSYRGSSDNSLYASLNSGLNIDGWYLRHNGIWNHGLGQDGYTALNTYVQRDLTPLRSRLLAGQSNTSGVLFDTLPFTGVQISSDERMLPASQRGYAPDIRGIARTNARVTVRQGGNVIYETTVSPGEFLINDLYPTGYGGDLQVTVTEADGTLQQFSVPYAAVAQLLRPGNAQFSLTAGRLRSELVDDGPALYQGTLQYGLSNTLTGYSGLQLSENYYAILAGAAVSTPAGAVAADVTQAATQLGNKSSSVSGQSYRFSWNKTLTDTGSNLSLATYRFSTSGYMDFLTAMQSRQAVERGTDINRLYRAKNRATLTASQALPENFGQFYVSASVQNYWNQPGSDVQYQLGYNNQFKTVSWGLSAGRAQTRTGAQQSTYLLSMSFPLGRSDGGHQPYVRMDWNRDSNGGNAQQATLSGNLGSRNQYGYSATASHDVRTGDSGSLNGQYRSSVTSLNGGISKGAGYRSTSLGASGTLVAHAGGVTLSPYTGETMALVEAKGAKGAQVSGYPGIEIDSFGYAAVPYLNPYQFNDIQIDPKNAPEDIELENTQQRVAPWAGAVVKVNFNSQRGTPLLISGSFKGQPLPFGADVQNSLGERVGSVGQGGQLYARVKKESGSLTVSWAKGAQGKCTIEYRIPVSKGKNQDVQNEMKSVCKPFIG